MKLIELLVKELPKSGGWPSEAVTAIYFSHKQGVTFYDKGGMGIKNGVSFICMDIHGARREEVTREEFEAALAKNDDWIEWGGGECPVDGDVVVDVKLNGHDGVFTHIASTISWRHVWQSANIIAYRPHRDINSRSNDDRLEQDLNECIGQNVDMPEWSGEGFPPAGCKCEVMESKARSVFDKWTPCTVIYFNLREGRETQACIIDDNGDFAILYGNDGVKFRPLRTEAERNREKAIEFMNYKFRELAGQVSGQEAVFSAIYDAIASGKIPVGKQEDK